MKRKNNIKKQLLIISLVPLFILALFLSNISNIILKLTMINDLESELKATVSSISNTLNNGINDKIESTPSGDFTINSRKLNEYVSYLDQIQEETGIDITIFYNDTRYTTTIKQNGERIVGTKASDDVIENVLNNGQNYFDKKLKIQGIKYYGYYIPLKDSSNKIVGMIFAGKPADHIDSSILKSIVIVTTIGILGLLLTLIFVIKKSNALAKILQSISEHLVNMTNGDLVHPLNKKYVERTDEIGIIAQKLEFLRDSIKDLISKSSITSTLLGEYSNSLYDSADICTHNASSINSAMDEISSGAVSQAETTQIASEKAINMGNLIKNITDSLSKIDKHSKEISKSKDEADIIINNSAKYNEITIDAVKRIKLQADKTNESAQKIKSTTELITDIAAQTNLLSLNASIEAARAGEAGRGFSVVAEEIQKLSDESNKSAKIIQDVIEDLLMQSQNTVTIMKEVDNAVYIQKDKITETKSKFEVVNAGISANIDDIHSISSKTDELLTIKDDIINVFENLSAISEENAASTEETTSSMTELSSVIKNISDSSLDLKGISEELKQSISSFKTE